MGFVLDKETGTFVEETPLKVQEQQKESVINNESGNVDIVNQGGPNIIPGGGLEDEPTESFKRLTDLSVFQIVDKPTGKVMGIISGYALQIKFNRQAITSAADVEQCAEGIKKLFYGIIMDQLLDNK